MMGANDSCKNHFFLPLRHHPAFGYKGRDGSHRQKADLQMPFPSSNLNIQSPAGFQKKKNKKRKEGRMTSLDRWTRQGVIPERDTGNLPIMNWALPKD